MTNVKIPLMFDSTEWQKMEAGLEHAGGKCILNSTNYEDGVPRFLKVIDLAKRYGASVVIGTIDEDGMARTAKAKLKIATRAYEQATKEAGLPASDIFFDPLALPISTGIEEDRRNALETIEAIKRIKAELPGCFHDSRRFEYLVWSESGLASRSEFRVSPRCSRSRTRRGDRQREQDRAAQPHRRTGTESRARVDLRPAPV